MPLGARPLAKWIEAWLLFSSVVCSFDAAYTFLWPRSRDGGAWTGMFYFWQVYADVDLRYANPNNEVLRSTERMMIGEIAINVVAIVFNRRRSPHTKLVGFMTSAFTLWKTVGYLMLYIAVPNQQVQFMNPDAPWWKAATVFWLPNSIWVLVPLFVMRSLWPRLVPTAPPANLLRANKRSRTIEEVEAVEGRSGNLLTGNV